MPPVFTIVDCTTVGSHESIQCRTNGRCDRGLQDIQSPRQKKPKVVLLRGISSYRRGDEPTVN